MRSGPTRGLALEVAALALVAGACTSESAGSAPPAEPTAGTWKTWVLSSPGQVQVPPPPRSGTAAARDELAEVRRLASDRTSHQEERARF